MTLLTTLIVLSIFYGSGAILCYNADTGTCKDENEIVIQQE